VTHKTVLFQPEWGVYDMAVGKKVTSAFSGPADVNSFDLIFIFRLAKRLKPNILRNVMILKFYTKRFEIQE
jgi:phenylalanine-4-hydroxylase